MSLITILVVLIVFGVVLYCINTLIPMDEKVKKIINIVAILFLVLWLLRAVGAFGYLDRVHV